MKVLGESIKDYAIYQDFLDDEALKRDGGKNNR